MNMLNTRSPFIVCIILITHLSVSPTIVKGDAALVHQVCTNTPYQKDCQDCFDNDSGAVQMTVRELAGVAMYCTGKLSGALRQAFDDLAAKETDPLVKTTYDGCSSALSTFGIKMTAAETLWWGRNDEESKEDYNAAKGEYENCKDALQKLSKSHPLPSQAMVQFEGVSNIFEDSYAIILQSEAKGGDV